MATEIASLFARISADTGGFRRGLNEVHSGLGGLHGPLGALGGAIKKTFMVGAGLVAGFGAAIVGATVKAAGMEQSVADIGAAMNLTSEETGKVKELINSLSLDPTLKVNAQEAAAAIDVLGRNGLTLNDILGGAARSTVLLANATGGDMALAADIATSAMQAFGLTAGDLDGLMSNISGTLVASKFGIQDYGLALAQAGGVAGAVGVSIEDFNATIAAISPLFQSGSDAGTSFKTFLQRLIPQSADAAAAMRDLGLMQALTGEKADHLRYILSLQEQAIAALDPTAEGYEKQLAAIRKEQEELTTTLNYGQSAFFNADGSMKSMADIAGILQQAIGGLSEEQKLNALSTIFGTDAMRAAVGLANTGQVAFTNLKSTIGKTDAEEQAKKRMDTLAGSWEIFRGVIDANVTALGDRFLPVARRMIDWATEWLNQHQPQITAAFDTIGKFLNDLADGFTGANTAGTSFANQLGRTIREQFDTIVKWIGDANFSLKGISTWFNENKDKIIDAAGKIADAVMTIADGIKAIGAFWNQGRAALGQFDSWLQRVGSFTRPVMEFLGNLSPNLPRIPDWTEWGNNGRAGGGPASGMTLVGERGPEIVNLPVGSYVNNNATSQNMGRGGTTITIQNVNLQGSGSSGNDLRSAVTFINSMWGYGY